jgi:hypothetical protein
MILLNADEHRQWEAAVATWPTCQTCGGTGEGSTPSYRCVDCDGFGSVPQPVYIVIEGVCPLCVEAGNGHDYLGPCRDWIEPAHWRVPERSVRFQDHGPDGYDIEFDPAVGEPCEIRAECWHKYLNEATGKCVWDGKECDDGSVLLSTAATVEVLPVVDVQSVERPASRYVLLSTGTGLALLVDADGTPHSITLDPLPVPGRHFVAVVTP